MARSRLADLMQTNRFWLMDIVPSETFPFYVLGAPLMGFQSISMPEYTADTDEIKQLNSMFKRTVYSGGSVSPIILTRGVRGYDDTMWQWMMRAIRGNDTTNRHLLLIHFTSIGVTSDLAISFPWSGELPLDAWESVAFLPGKAYVLYDCIPTRYKPGSDFDAMSGAVSIAELEIQPWAFSEITLMSPL